MLKVNQLTGFWYAPADFDFLGGAALVLGEPNAMGIDFTYHTDINKQVKIRGTGSYYGSAYGKLTYTAPSIKLCRQSDGVWRYGNHNTLPRSQEFDNATWGTFGSITKGAADSTTAPDGSSTADAINFTGGYGEINQSPTNSPGVWQLSVWAKRNAGSDQLITLKFNDGGNFYSADLTVTSAWQRFTFSRTNTNSNFGIAIANGLATLASSVYLWGAELKRLPVQEAGGFTPATGYLATTSAAAYDLPYEWDISGNSLGILVEEARTNFALYSQEFGGAAWTATRLTISANATTAPDGTSTADTATPNSTNDSHDLAWVNGATSGTITISVFVKPNGYSKVGFRENSINGTYVAFHCSGAGSVLASGNTGFISASCTQDINGWYRVVFTLTGFNSGNMGFYVLDDAYTTGNPQAYDYAGNTTSGVYLWGFQTEPGAFATSPIHTVAGSVTRVLDNISLPTASFPYQTEPASWYGKGMIDSGVIAIVNTLICGDAGGPAEPLRAGSATSIQVSNNLDFAQSDNGGSWFTAPRMAASRYALNDYAVVKDGDSTPGVDTSTAAIPSSTNMFFGGRSNQTLMWNGHIHHIAFFKRALSDAELISKTNDGPGASDLLLNENDGMSFDFLYAEVARQCRIKDNTTLANNFHGAPRAKLTYTSPSAKLTRQSDGVWRYGNHNLALQSQDFSSWTNQAVTTTVNTTTAPDGTSTADLVVPTATSNSHNVNRTDLPGVIAAHTATIYAKAAGYNWVEIMLSDTGFSQYFGASFNVSTGATGTTRSSTWTGSSSITAVANGFYKIVIVAIPGTVTPNRITIGVHSADDFGNVFTGNGTSGVYLWGAGVKRYPVQEASGVAGYLATGGAAVYDLPYEWSTALASQGILIEEARTNLMLRSQEFDNASWTKDSTTITANNTTAPDGTSTADRINVTAANAEHRLYQSGSSGVEVRTQSVFAKAGTASFIGVTGTGTSTAGATFDLSNGTVGNIGAGVTSATMTAEANGWYRCNVTNVSGTTEYLVVTIGDTAAHAVPGTIWNAAGTETVYLWDGQVEVGAFPTSPIHTIAATVTRAVDNITLLTSAFPYSATAGSVVAAAIWPRSATFGTGGANLKIITLTDGTANENLRLGKTDGVGSVKLSINDSGNFVEPATGSSIVNSVMFKAAFANTTNDVALVLNGGTPATNATSVTPTCTKMAFGQDFNTTQLFNGYICQITYLKRRATNVELQAKTS